MPRIALIEGVTMALAHELRNDDRVVVLGEDPDESASITRHVCQCLLGWWLRGEAIESRWLARAW